MCHDHFCFTLLPSSACLAVRAVPCRQAELLSSPAVCDTVTLSGHFQRFSALLHISHLKITERLRVSGCNRQPRSPSRSSHGTLGQFICASFCFLSFLLASCPTAKAIRPVSVLLRLSHESSHLLTSL